MILCLMEGGFCEHAIHIFILALKFANLHVVIKIITLKKSGLEVGSLLGRYTLHVHLACTRVITLCQQQQMK